MPRFPKMAIFVFTDRHTKRLLYPLCTCAWVITLGYALVMTCICIIGFNNINCALLHFNPLYTMKQVLNQMSLSASCTHLISGDCSCVSVCVCVHACMCVCVCVCTWCMCVLVLLGSYHQEHIRNK